MGFQQLVHGSSVPFGPPLRRSPSQRLRAGWDDHTSVAWSEGFLALANICGVAVGFAWERTFMAARTNVLRRFGHWSRAKAEDTVPQRPTGKLEMVGRAIG